MFADLNLQGATPQEQREALAAAVALGYGTVALNVSVAAPFFPRDLPAFPRLTDQAVLAASPAARDSASYLQSVVQGTPALRQLRRLTVLGSPEDESAEPILASLKHALQGGALHDLHIVAAQPRSQAALAKLCTSTQVDCISLDVSSKLPFKLRFPMVAAAVKRGIFFEIQYAPLLDPATLRQSLINCQMILEVTRGRNIVVSSGASTPSQLRSPGEAASLCALFRLHQGAAARALSSNALALLDGARKRRLLYRDTVWLDNLLLLSSSGQTQNPESATGQVQATEGPQLHGYAATAQADASLEKNRQLPLTQEHSLPAALQADVSFAKVLQLEASAASTHSATRQHGSSLQDLGFLSLDMDTEWETVARKSGRKAKRKH